MQVSVILSILCCILLYSVLLYLHIIYTSIGEGIKEVVALEIPDSLLYTPVTSAIVSRDCSVGFARLTLCVCV